MKKKILILLGVVAVAAAAWFFMQGENEGDGSVAVETAMVAKDKIVQTVNATGRIQPKTQVKISADISAKIISIHIKEGDWVEKGDLLLKLDGERYRAAVEGATANLRSFEANAKLAKANLNKAEKDYQRTRELHARKLESQATLDAMFAALEVEKARYESALDQVEQTRGVLKQAQDDLSKTIIYAPMPGTISELNKEAGEIALGSQFQEDVIMVVSDLDGMEALVDVDENDIVSISLADSARIEVDAFPGQVFTGTVSEIANSAKVSGMGSADQKTEFEVKVAIAGNRNSGSAGIVNVSNDEVRKVKSSGSLRPGMTASSDIVTEVRESALCVPLQSVAVRTVDELQSAGDEEEYDMEYEPDGDGFVEVVFVVNDGKVLARQVTTGIQSDTHIEILAGLSEDDEIVIGNYRAISKDLQNGTAVTVSNKSEEEDIASR